MTQNRARERLVTDMFGYPGAFQVRAFGIGAFGAVAFLGFAFQGVAFQAPAANRCAP